MKLKSLMTAALALPLLSACTLTDRAFSAIGNEAGIEVTSSGLGVATASNIAMLTGDANGAMIANLTLLFAQDVPARINFAFNSARLDAGAQQALRQQAQWINAHSAIVFRVYGHTDKVGTEAYNKRLGMRRARAAVNFLVAQGVSRSKLQAVASFGETRPLVLTESENRQNRRTVTEVSGFYRRGRGSDLDGKYAKTVYDTYISTTYSSPVKSQ